MDLAVVGFKYGILESSVCGQMSADVWRRQVFWLLVRSVLQEVGNNNNKSGLG